jgi:hypothetical protein
VAREVWSTWARSGRSSDELRERRTAAAAAPVVAQERERESVGRERGELSGKGAVLWARRRLYREGGGEEESGRERERPAGAINAVDGIGH